MEEVVGALVSVLVAGLPELVLRTLNALEEEHVAGERCCALGCTFHFVKMQLAIANEQWCVITHLHDLLLLNVREVEVPWQ